MSEQAYICNDCRGEFTVEARPGIFACPRCGSLNTQKYHSSDFFSRFLGSLQSGGGG